MISLYNFKAVVTAKPLSGEHVSVILSLNSEDEIDKAVHALGRFFAEDDSRYAVRLDVHGDKLGYLNRRDFFSGQTRGKLGGSEPATLPGPPEFSFIKLACPIEGCDTLILKIHYDERNPERCPVHTDNILQAVE